MKTKILPLILVLLALFGLSACQETSKATDANPKSQAEYAPAASPSEAFKQLYAAVKSQNTAAIEAVMSKATQQLAEGTAQMRKISVAEMYKNGLTESTLSAALPPTRDEQIEGNFAALKVQNPKGEWEELPFINEDGGWKLAVGNVFNGSYKHPGGAAAKAGSNPAPPAAPSSATNTDPVNDSNAKNSLSANKTTKK